VDPQSAIRILDSTKIPLCCIKVSFESKKADLFLCIGNHMRVKRSWSPCCHFGRVRQEFPGQCKRRALSLEGALGIQFSPMQQTNHSSSLGAKKSRPRHLKQLHQRTKAKEHSVPMHLLAADGMLLKRVIMRCRKSPKYTSAPRFFARGPL